MYTIHTCTEKLTSQASNSWSPMTKNSNPTSKRKKKKKQFLGLYTSSIDPMPFYYHKQCHRQAYWRRREKRWAHAHTHNVSKQVPISIHHLLLFCTFATVGLYCLHRHNTKQTKKERRQSAATIYTLFEKFVCNFFSVFFFIIIWTVLLFPSLRLPSCLLVVIVPHFFVMYLGWIEKVFFYMHEYVRYLIWCSSRDEHALRIILCLISQRDKMRKLDACDSFGIIS